MSRIGMDTRHGRVAVRTADAGELDQLARVWYDAWQDAHAAIVPAALTRLRTLESFRVRLLADLQHIRVVGPIGDPVAFSIVKGDELYQLFVAAPVRGLGVALSLLEDAEARLAARGVERAWLACAIGKRPCRALLRKTRLAPRRDGRQYPRDHEWHIPAGRLALREEAAATCLNSSVADVTVPLHCGHAVEIPRRFTCQAPGRDLGKKGSSCDEDSSACPFWPSAL